MRNGTNSLATMGPHFWYYVNNLTWASITNRRLCIVYIISKGGVNARITLTTPVLAKSRCCLLLRMNMGELRKCRVGRARLISNAGVGVGSMFVLKHIWFQVPRESPSKQHPLSWIDTSTNILSFQSIHQPTSFLFIDTPINILSPSLQLIHRH